VLDHPLEPVFPGFKDTWQHLLVDSSRKFGERVQEILPTLTIVIRWFLFDISTKKEVTRGQVLAASRMRQALGS
jgi:hypothetical protein